MSELPTQATAATTTPPPAARGQPMKFKVRVEYADNAHPPQILAVDKNSKIRTAADAEAHCLSAVKHIDCETKERYPCIKAVAVRQEPYPIGEALPSSEAVAAMQAHMQEIK